MKECSFELFEKVGEICQYLTQANRYGTNIMTENTHLAQCSRVTCHFFSSFDFSMFLEGKESENGGKGKESDIKYINRVVAFIE